MATAKTELITPAPAHPQPDDGSVSPVATTTLPPAAVPQLDFTPPLPIPVSLDGAGMAPAPLRVGIHNRSIPDSKKAFNPEEERAMVEAAKRYESGAWSKIYEEYFPKILSDLSYHLGDRQLAEDMASETFVKAMLGIHRFASRAPFSSWLFRIAHNLRVDHHRTAHKIPLPLDDLRVAVEIDGPDATNPLLTQRLAHALSQLTTEQKKVIIGKFLKELSNKELAQGLGKNVGAVKALQHRALGALRELLNEAGENIPASSASSKKDIPPKDYSFKRMLKVYPLHEVHEALREASVGQRQSRSGRGVEFISMRLDVYTNVIAPCIDAFGGRIQRMLYMLVYESRTVAEVARVVQAETGLQIDLVGEIEDVRERINKEVQEKTGLEEEEVIDLFRSTPILLLLTSTSKADNIRYIRERENHRRAPLPDATFPVLKMPLRELQEIFGDGAPLKLDEAIGRLDATVLRCVGPGEALVAREGATIYINRGSIEVANGAQPRRVRVKDGRHVVIGPNAIGGIKPTAEQAVTTGPTLLRIFPPMPQEQSRTAETAEKGEEDEEEKAARRKKEALAARTARQELTELYRDLPPITGIRDHRRRETPEE